MRGGDKGEPLPGVGGAGMKGWEGERGGKFLDKSTGSHADSRKAASSRFPLQRPCGGNNLK